MSKTTGSVIVLFSCIVSAMAMGGEYLPRDPILPQPLLTGDLAISDNEKITTHPQFTTTVVITTIVDGALQPSAIAGIDNNQTQWLVDDQRKIQIRHQFGKSPFAPAAWVGTPLEWFNFSYYQLQSSGYMVLNGACLLPTGQQEQPWQSPLAWLQYAQPAGECTHSKGVGCKKIAFSFKSSSGASMNTLEYIDEKPTYMSVNYTCLLKQGCGPIQHGYSEEYVFSDDFVWSIDKTQLNALNVSSCTHPSVCPTTQPLVPRNMSLWIFHPAHNFNISGQDLGDVNGDVFFMCEDLLQGEPSTQDHNYGWVTEWEIELLPKFGQYQNCNNYPPQCIGENDFLVGREAALNLGFPDAGQCTTNNLTGTWYSLPIGGQCAPGAVPGDGSCSWRIARRVKTIDSLCVTKTHGMRAACALEGRAPFSKAQEVFKAAFASNTNSTGGCPPIA